MKDRTIPVLLIGILLFGSMIAVQEYLHSRNNTRRIERLKTFDIDHASLTALEFKSTNILIRCVKEGGVWMVGEEGKGMGPADVALFYELIAAFNATTNATTITEKELKQRGLNAAEYGFDPPMYEISAVDNRGRRNWQIGRTTPLGNEVYVRETGWDEICTIPAEVLKLIPGDPDLLRNRVLFSAEAAGIKRLEIRGPSGFVRISKETSGQWQIQQPIVAPADPQELATYLDNLYRVRVEDFLQDNVSDFSAYGLQNESKQISMGYAEGSSRTIILGDAIPGRPGMIYARRADDTSVFALNENVLQFINVTAALFRDARIVTIPKPEISQIFIKHADEQLELLRDDAGHWQVRRPVIWDADAESVSNLIDFWNHAVITEFDVATNNIAGEWELEFISREAALTNRIEVLPRERTDGLMVRLNQDPMVFQINLPIIPDLIINPMEYKDKQIWDLHREDISKLILTRNGQSREVVERTADGGFVAAEANGNAQADADAIDQMIDRLCTVTTSQYIAYNPRNLDIYGLTSPAVELYVGLVDSNELGRVLLVGLESTEGYYSMIKGRDVVFYLDKETVDSISSDLVIKPDIPVQVPNP